MGRTRLRSNAGEGHPADRDAHNSKGGKDQRLVFPPEAGGKDGLTASGDTHLCQRTQLNVDFVHRKVQLVAMDRCHPGEPAVIEEVRTFPMFERKSP
jgi:hypothetical protein